MRVLVVDDSRMVRRRMVALIAAIPAVTSVLQAADGAEGLALAFAERPDVLVVDVRMPRVNGFQVLSALEGEDIAPVRIVVSNHAEYMTHALLLGATHFYDKTRQLAELVTTLIDLGDRKARVC
jgi:YesN/AraC family two-component response regulator